MREFVDGNVKPFDSGKVAFSFLVPRKAAIDDPVTSSLADRAHIVCAWGGDERRAVLSPYDEGTLSLLIVQPDKDVQFNGESSVQDSERLLANSIQVTATRFYSTKTWIYARALRQV